MMKNISFLFAIYADGKLTIINCQGISYSAENQYYIQSKKQAGYINSRKTT